MRFLNLLTIILATASLLAVAATDCEENRTDIPLTPYPTTPYLAPEPSVSAPTATPIREPYLRIALEPVDGAVRAGEKWKIDFTVKNQSPAPAYDVTLELQITGRGKPDYLGMSRGECTDTVCRISSLEGNESVNGHISVLTKPGFGNNVRLDANVKWSPPDLRRGPSSEYLTVYVADRGQPGGLVWSTGVKNSSMSCSDDQIAVGQDAIYTVYSHDIYALSRYKGEVKWRIEGEDHMFTPHLEGDSLYVRGSQPGDSWRWSHSVSSMDATTGELNWRRPVEEEALVPIVVHDDGVYFTVRDYVGDRISNYTDLVALDKATGVLNWRYRVDKRHNSPATEFDGDIYFATSGRGPNFLHSVNAITGELRRKYPVPAGSRARPLVIGGYAYLATADDLIYSMDLASGETMWQYRPEGAVDHLSGFYQGNLYFLLYDRQEPGYVAVEAVEAETGVLAWEYQPGGTLRNLSVTSNGIYVSTPTNLTSLDAATGNVKWQIDYVGICGSLAAADGYLYGRASNDEQGTFAFAIKAE